MFRLLVSAWRRVAGASFRAGGRSAGGVPGRVWWGVGSGFVARWYHPGDAGQCQGMLGSATWCQEGFSQGGDGLEGVAGGEVRLVGR
jgi:hypothetical protein